MRTSQLTKGLTTSQMLKTIDPEVLKLGTVSYQAKYKQTKYFDLEVGEAKCTKAKDGEYITTVYMGPHFDTQVDVIKRKFKDIYYPGSTIKLVVKPIGSFTREQEVFVEFKTPRKLSNKEVRSTLMWIFFERLGRNSAKKRVNK
jgi:hypothetical protein